MRDVVEEHPLVLKDPEPVIQVNELAESSVNFICRPWAKTADYWTVYWDLMRMVKERFDSEGISIPFPQRDVHFFQESSKAASKTDQTPPSSQTIKGGDFADLDTNTDADAADKGDS
jgi:small conductance mechanosensitive channel